MGVIYLAESPSGRAYIGQTKGSMQKRWTQHVTEALGLSERGCRRLNEAIRKYEGETFSLLECWRCANDELDEWEILFIELFDTFHPAGYNLTKGGQNSRGEYSDDTRQKMSVAKRFNFYDGTDLPPGVTYVKAGETVGFRVRVGDHHLRVMGAAMDMKEKLSEALAIHQQAQKGELEVGIGRKKRDPRSAELPTYVSYSAERGNYGVQRPGYPRKTFGARKDPERAKQKALAYLEQINTKERAVQRLDGRGALNAP